MPKRGRIGIYVLAVMLWGANAGLSFENYLPEDVQQTPAPVPMVSHDMKSLTKVVSSEGDGLLIFEKDPRQNGEARVRFKTLKVEDDQEAGIVVRYQDPKNFYVIVVNGKEESCAFYRVKEGKRKRISSQDQIVAPLAWHTLRVVFVQDKFTALLDDELVIGAKDSALKNPGLIGLWTKAGASITFDDFRISRS